MNDSEPFDSSEDDVVASAIRSLDQDAPDAAPSELHAAFDAAGDLFDADDQDSDQTTHLSVSNRSFKMVAKIVLTVSSLAACYAVIFSIGGDPTFGEVLARSVDATSLQLTVTRDGNDADVLVRFPNQVRWQETPSLYQIASGSSLWKIDEQQNLLESGDNPWLQPNSGKIDLFALTGLKLDRPTELASLRPTAIKGADGKRLLLFQSRVEFETQRGFVEAIADAESGTLRSISAWHGNSKKGPPVSELRLVARDVNAEDDQFVVAESLREDGRLGKLVDAQGDVTLKPKMADRWTPVSYDVLIKPGDWLRTNRRGANAAAVMLTTGVRLTLGPGTLLEFRSPTQLRLHSGEVHFNGERGKGKPLQLIDPSEQTLVLSAKKSAHYRVDRDGKLNPVKNAPPWLKGFEGTSTNESLGSLICNVDGRDVPLTVGFHNVKVEIRDQIARTTIEESFVNHTRQRLEGIFHFPLPPDASISGFGMWIGGELIEADVVEKQRAREIYETILRERRDPGLLEWAGGNLFKARVFPIEPHSEKRIRIVYTQVLPMKANRYRYSYGLRSELLRKNPLRSLSLDVLVHSALPLKDVRCSSHAVRKQGTRNSAKLEFTAEEYTPDRDFEVVCEVDSGTSDVVMVPHQRGSDGYFLAQITPPGEQGDWQRELLPDGDPLELLIVCDTSSSMDSEKRTQQRSFVRSLLSALGPKDRYNLAVSDVDCTWRFDQFESPTDRSRDEALEWLDQRESLGWTDLDQVAKSSAAKRTAKTHLIYVGDGIVTARDGDAQQFAKRVRRLLGDGAGPVHAVSVGNSYESVVLKALASIGGGSVRKIAGDQTPSRIAFELLNEISQPGLRDLKVEFKGLRVAAVYPQTLPNLSAGTQQIVIGRYLPDERTDPPKANDAPKSAQIVVTGQRDGEPVRFSARVDLDQAESGNSFIPRLWARAHMEHLLQQGQSDLIKEQIISLSEDFHIITPYTSLLVLETDEDRERFGVKRRFQMRDGERFFADGADSANLELLQQQMKHAGDWRIALRRKILWELTRLGRDPGAFQTQRGQTIYAVSGAINFSGGVGGAMGGGGGLGVGGRLLGNGAFGGGGFDSRIAGQNSPMNLLSKSKSLDAINDLQANMEAWDTDAMRSNGQFSNRMKLNMPARPSSMMYQPQSVRADFSRLSRQQSAYERYRRSGSKSSLAAAASQPIYGGYYVDPLESIRWVDTLIPKVPSIPAKPVAVKRDKSAWTDEAILIADSLKQPVLTKDGLEVDLKTLRFDADWDRTLSQSHQVDLYDENRWLRTTFGTGMDTTVQWCTDEFRGIYSKAFQLGRERKRHSRDHELFLLGQRPYADGGLHRQYPNHSVEVQKNDSQAVLTLTPPGKGTAKIRITVDTDRKVVLKSENIADGKTYSSTVYEDHVEVADGWWPRKITTMDAEERLVSEQTQTVKALGADRFDRRIASQMPAREKVLVLSTPLPSIREARIALANNSARPDDALAMVLQSCVIQDWDGALRHFETFARLSNQRSGVAWIRSALLAQARRNEAAFQDYVEHANRLVRKPSDLDAFLVQRILDISRPFSNSNERLALLDQLRPVFDRSSDPETAKSQWLQHRTGMLRESRRSGELIDEQRELAEANPWDVAAQSTYARDLRDAGDLRAALAWLREQWNRKEHIESRADSLRDTYATLLTEEREIDDLILFLAKWLERSPKGHQVPDRYLWAMTLARRVDDADQTAMQWLRDGRQDGQLDRMTTDKVRAAISYCVGSGYKSYRNWMDRKWRQPLRESAEFYLHHEHHFGLATSIIDNHRFYDSKVSDQLREEISNTLLKSCDTIDASRLSFWVRWSVRGKWLSERQCVELAKTIRSRWEDAEEPATITLLGNALIEVYTSRLSSEYVPFLRARIARAQRDGRYNNADTYTTALINHLIQGPWSGESEVEALDLIVRKRMEPVEGVHTFEAVGFLHRFVDAMINGRVEASKKALNGQGHPEKLTRTEYSSKLADFLKDAREGVAKTLASCESRLDDSELAKWVRIERRYIDLRLRRLENEVAKECWNWLGKAPAARPDPIEGLIEDGVAESALLEEVFEARVIAMLQYLGVRKSAPKKLTERLFAYLLAGSKLDGIVSEDWRDRLHSYLIALDRPDELQNLLESWIRNDLLPEQRQISLGYLLAERGEIKTAIQQFEAAARDVPLPPAELRALSNWYLLVDRRDDYAKSRTRFFHPVPEHEIQQWIYGQRQGWQQGGPELPTELDEDVLYAFEALFKKSNRPSDYMADLKQFYTACRDFRLVRMLPDAVVGQTQQAVYPMLNAIRKQVLTEVRKEATSDELRTRIRELRETASVVDQRALDLFDAMVSRQASQVLDQPGPHVDACMAALERAFKDQWRPGEVRQMSELISDFGRTKQTRLAEQQRQLLGSLIEKTEAGSDDRLFVSWYQARNESQSLGNHLVAIGILENAMAEYEASQTKGSGWPAELNPPLFGLVELLDRQGRFADAESLLSRLADGVANDLQRRTLIRRRDEVWVSALRHNGTVSVGEGKTLFHQIQDQLTERAMTGDDNHRTQTLTLLVQAFRTAHDKRIEGHKDDFRKFALETMSKILERHTDNHSNIVNLVAIAMRDVLGLRDAFEYLLLSFENYPQNVSYSWQSAWQRHGYQLASWHKQLHGKVNDLEPRLLEIVLKELRRDLTTRNAQSRYFYHDNYGPRFWKEKAADFARVAEEVLADNPDSGRNVAYVADYLYGGLDLSSRAIEVMLAAHENELLTDSQQMSLCRWLHERRRHAESIPILEPLVERQPNEMYYRTSLITAYSNTNQPGPMRKLLRETDERFRQDGRWVENDVARLARCCHGASLYEEAIGYFKEAIAMHERSRDDRGIGAGVLSNYYSDLSRSYVGIKDTAKAVDAASAGIIAWGPNHAQRNSATYWLKRAIADSKDLDGYVQFLDQQAKDTGQDSPLIRKQIGIVYLERSKHDKAIAQLRAAITLQPEDAETHQALIKCFEAKQDTASIARQLMAQIDLDSHNLDLYKKLAKTLEKDSALAERAVTSIVEAAPNEASHHRAFAEIREGQDRWGDAIAHWRKVAQLRALEPDGLLGLATAQIHQKDWDGARESVRSLSRTRWADRFREVESQTRKLAAQIPE